MKFSLPFGICAICKKLSVLERKRIAVSKGTYRKYKSYRVCSECSSLSVIKEKLDKCKQ